MLNPYATNVLRADTRISNATACIQPFEKEKKFSPVSSMLEWASTFTRARRRQPYKVIEHHDSLDFGSRALTTMKNLKYSDT